MDNVAKPLKKLEVSQVEELLKDSSKVVIVQTAPAVRVSLGEMFSLPIGTKVKGKMITALRKIGFSAVFDTDFGADLTVVEESAEFLKRIKKGGPYPQFNSCCIGWVQLAIRAYQNFFDGLISTVKSPLGCFGAVARKYYAAKKFINPEDLVVVSIVPCILKKNENQLPYNTTDGFFDVDYTWTTKDLANHIMERGIDFNSLEDGEFDDPLGESTGGATIFGRSGGVLEAIIRTSIYLDTGKVFTDDLVFTPSPLSADIKECTITLAGQEIKVCHCGMVGAKLISSLVQQGNCPYHFVEVMACPGGCIMGAGQPMHLPKEGVTPQQVRDLRSSALNDIDHSQEIRVSALNKSLLKVYDAIFDGEFGSKKAEEVLHRRYK